MRIKVGDVIENKYASENNPLKRGLYAGEGRVISFKDGKHYVAKYDIATICKDEQHFVVMGNLHLEDLIDNVFYLNEQAKEEL